MSQNIKKIPISNYARLSINPLRKITQEQKIDPNPAKKSITLQLGDPTIFGYNDLDLLHPSSLDYFFHLHTNIFLETFHLQFNLLMLSITQFIKISFRII